MEGSIIELYAVPGKAAYVLGTHIPDGYPNTIEILGWQEVRLWMDINGVRHRVEAQYDDIKDLGTPFIEHYDSTSEYCRRVLKQGDGTRILAMPILVTLSGHSIIGDGPEIYTLQGILLKKHSRSPGGMWGMARIGRFEMRIYGPEQTIGYLMRSWHPEKRVITLV